MSVDITNIIDAHECDLVELSHNHSMTMLGYHIVMCPKYRHSIFKGRVRLVCINLIKEIVISCHGMVIALEVMPDHVHLVCQLPPTLSISDFVRCVKSKTAVGIFHEFPDLKRKKFWGSGLWSRGFFAATVGKNNIDIVKRYVNTQYLR